MYTLFYVILFILVIYGITKFVVNFRKSKNANNQRDSFSSLSPEELKRIADRIDKLKKVDGSTYYSVSTIPDKKAPQNPPCSTKTKSSQIHQNHANPSQTHIPGTQVDSISKSKSKTNEDTKSYTKANYQTEYEKGHKEIEEGIKSGKYRVTQVPGNARTNKPSAKSKKPSYLQPSTKQSYSKPPTKPNSDEINPDKLDGYPLPQQRLLLTQYYKTHYFQSNSCGEIPLGEGLCPKDGHILFRADTFYKSKLYKQVLCCQKCHTIYPYEKVKYVDFTEGKHILYVCKKHTVGTKNNHKTVSVTGFLGLRGGNKIQINVSYCYNCKRFFIYYKAYEEYRRKHGRDIMGDIVFLEDSLNAPESFGRPESILREYGYTVNVNSRLNSSDRQRILRWIIDNNILPKTDVIGYLSIFIERGKNIPSWHDAVLKWQSDLAYIQEYKCSSQQTVEIGPIVKWRH